MEKTQAKARIARLKKEINYHRYLYHVLDRQEISDSAHDSLKAELAELETQFPELVTPDSPTQRVGGIALPGFRKIRHGSPMLSLNDAFSEKELYEWEARLKKLSTTYNLQPTTFSYFAELKVDGFAIALRYEKGLLKTAATRGDGAVGEDVTENVRTIESVPLVLPNPKTLLRHKEIQRVIQEFPRVRRATSNLPDVLEIRGEVYMTKQAFQAINREQQKKGLPAYANPRNIAAGSIRQLDPKAAASRKLDFLCYDVLTDLGQETHEEDHLIAKLFGFKTDPFAKPCNSTVEVVKFWNRALDMRDNLPFLIDGVVVQVNHSKFFDELGVVGKAPRGAVALKFPGVEATTLIEDITVQIGRTGVLTPVARLRPVAIAGVTVSRATLHNMDEIKRLDVRVGDTVIVQRAGDVIPDIVRVLKNMRPKNAKPFRMPRKFCGQPVVRRAGEVAHRILRPEECAQVKRERLYHFVSKNAFDITGLGPKIIDQLAEHGLVEDPADLFTLTVGDLTPLERFAEKSAGNLIAAIKEKKEIALSRFLVALGVIHVGEETAIDLAAHFGTLEKLEQAPLENFVAMPNIGEVVAHSIHGWFRDKRNQALVGKLKKVGVRIKHQESRIAGAKLRGKMFVLTGTLETMTRDEAKKRIRELGGNISESVSKTTDYVVTGKNPGSKFQNAKAMKIRTINEQAFEKLIR